LSSEITKRIEKCEEKNEGYLDLSYANIKDKDLPFIVEEIKNIPNLTSINFL
jgi:hypothetical protein